jgi:hypothetical protein
MRLLKKIFGSRAKILEYKQNYSSSTGITKSINFNLSEAKSWDKETTNLMEDEDDN